MQRLFFIHFLYFYALFYISPISAQQSLRIDWSVATELPSIDGVNKNPGVAGAFIGVHNDVLLIAGGANFPNGMPWEGGMKSYRDEVYVLQRNNKKEFNWISNKKFKLRSRIAYGASVSTPQGIVCIGGENENGKNKDVFLLQWDVANKNIVVKNLLPLPFAVANASVVIIEKIIYVAGGETGNSVSDKLFCFDLNNPNAGWTQRSIIPKTISHAVMIVQFNGHDKNIYLVGGRSKNSNGISDLYNSVLAFDIKRNEWSEKASLPYALSAGTGIAIARNKIFVFGGDKGEAFHKTEELIADINLERDENKRSQLIRQKNQLQATHPGFNSEVLVYNTIKDKWEMLDTIPFPEQVTTTAVKWNNDIIIPSGEIKAGVRTPKILLGKLNYKK